MAKLTKAKYPEKTSINLAVRETKTGNLKLQLIIFAVFLAALGIFTKFGVIDRMQEASQAVAANVDMRAQLSELQDYNRDYDKVKEEYSHYSQTFLNEEEMLQADRIEVLSMLEQHVMAQANVENMQVAGNKVNLTLGNTDLTTVSRIVAALESDNRTSYVTVSTAGTNNGEVASQLVTANVEIELKAGGGENAEP